MDIYAIKLCIVIGINVRRMLGSVTGLKFSDIILSQSPHTACTQLYTSLENAKGFFYV